MRILRSAMKWALDRLGYRLVRQDGPPPREAANLRHLAVAYEHLLGRGDPDAAIPPDGRRLEILGRLLGTPPPEAYAIVQALIRTAHLDGDVCEFGVAQGETSALIANEIRGSGRRLHLFDSFEGLPAPSDRDVLVNDIFSLGSIEAYEGWMACPEESVVERLEVVGFPADRYVIHRGFIESSLATDRDLPGRVSFAYVDLDFYRPIKTALEFLDRVVQVGGIVVVDDYGYFSGGAKTAVDEFLAQVDPRGSRYAVAFSDAAVGCFASLTRVGADATLDWTTR